MLSHEGCVQSSSLLCSKVDGQHATLRPKPGTLAISMVDQIDKGVAKHVRRRQISVQSLGIRSEGWLVLL